MKARTLIFSLASILLLALTTCKKDPQPIMERFDLSREDLTVGTTSASIVGTYAYPGAIDEITVCVSEDGVHPATFAADINGKNFSVEMTGLRPATSYQYYYSVDYGFSKPFTTEAKTFTTLSESPTVRTIDLISIDSTTVRVNCEIVSDGGVEITERGVCWNTYGNPNLDDEIITYSSAGIGQYSCRISGLAFGKKYYIKAYAKNASGIGFGEELEFETAAPPGMPVSIELSCDPEDGGSVNGGGIYTVGSQCTVNAVANSGYTFVNWTENGSQVSTDATYTFTVTRECSLVANFTTQAYIITAEVTPDNSGTVTGAGGYNYGEECSLTATAKPGYEFVKWTKNGTNVSTNATFTFIVNASATYVAHFQSKSYTISVSAQPGNGGSTTGGGTYNYGQSCTVRATSSEGYTFVNWTDDGDEVSANTNYTFTVMGNRTLVANFSLQAVLPTVTTGDVTDITQTTAIGGGNVTNDGGATVTEHGICWSTSHNPTTSGSHANSGTGTGTFTVNMTGLTPNTAYYVRAYAINSAGTSYGTEVSFSTLSGGSNTPQGAINGLFSVSSTHQVWFSKGNLQYIGSASTPYWKFADNQWDYLGDNGQGSTSQSVDRDLFGWGTSGWSGSGATYYRPWDTNTSNGNLYGPPGQYNLTGTFTNADWGVYNAISNGGNQTNQWRTLTKDEWVYVFNTRSTSSGIRYAMAKVNDVNGVILLPDNWSSSYYTLCSTNGGASFSSNVISSSTWASSLEQHGAVFLPAAGLRASFVGDMGSHGCYWSASCYNSAGAYVVLFYDSLLDLQLSYYRYCGQSVRLVQDY